MTNKVMISDLLYDAPIVITDTVKGKTYYYVAEPATCVEDAWGIVSTVVLRKGKQISLKKVMSGEW